jgi:sugar lactone lactonase YvrE
MSLQRTALCIAIVALAGTSYAHPSAGIVVDEQGQVFFTDNGGNRASLWKIDAEGKATRLSSAGWHWLALDAKGHYAEDNLKKWFEQRITMNFGRVGLPNTQATLLQADGAPFVIDREGNLYWGNLDISRLSPDGEVTLPFPDLKATADNLGGVKGLATGAEGSLYMTCPSAVLKAALDGKIMTLVHPIRLSDADFDLPAGTPDEYKPFLRGLAVDARGIVYAAATGGRCVVRITPDGRNTVVLKSEKPWSPTGVAVHRSDVYVLEYTNANGSPNDGWRPRVRKLQPDGTVTMMFGAE